MLSYLYLYILSCIYLHIYLCIYLFLLLCMQQGNEGILPKATSILIPVVMGYLLKKKIHARRIL